MTKIIKTFLPRFSGSRHSPPTWKLAFSSEDHLLGRHLIFKLRKWDLADGFKDFSIFITCARVETSMISI